METKHSSFKAKENIFSLHSRFELRTVMNNIMVNATKIRAEDVTPQIFRASEYCKCIDHLITNVPEMFCFYFSNFYS